MCTASNKHAASHLAGAFIIHVAYAIKALSWMECLFALLPRSYLMSHILISVILHVLCIGQHLHTHAVRSDDVVDPFPMS